MGRKKIDAPVGAPPAGVGGADYRRRAGKVGITVNATPQERDKVRVAAAQAGLSMSAYLLACALERANGRPSRTPPAHPAPQEEGGG
jgi:hypothetical protein